MCFFVDQVFLEKRNITTITTGLRPKPLKKYLLSCDPDDAIALPKTNSEFPPVKKGVDGRLYGTRPILGPVDDEKNKPSLKKLPFRGPKTSPDLARSGPSRCSF